MTAIDCIRCGQPFEATPSGYADLPDLLCEPCVWDALSTAPERPKCVFCGVPEDEDSACLDCFAAREPGTALVLAADVVHVWEETTSTWFGSPRPSGQVCVSLWASSPAFIPRATYEFALAHHGDNPVFVAACPCDSDLTRHLASHGGSLYLWRCRGLWWTANEDLTSDEMVDAIVVNRGFQVSEARQQRGRRIEAENRAQEDRLVAEAEAIEAERRRASQVARARSVLETEQAGSNGRRQPIPRETRLAVFTRDGGRCVECGNNFDIQYDHIIPVAMGGSSTVENLQILCADCNRRKGATLG